MGYSATQESGEPITIPDGVEFWNSLSTTALSSDYPGEGRFSWTASVAEYENDSDKDDAQHAADMMADYGFDIVEVNFDCITLHSWGGDKIGSSWDEIWSVIALHAEPYEWVMRGEDGDFWQESNPSNVRQHRVGAVTFDT
jgi:hypothetical protein